MTARPSQKINKGKLRREIIIITAILLTIFLVRFIPWLLVQPIPGNDPYGQYKELLHLVEKFDYNNGNRQYIEARIRGSEPSLRTSPAQDYYNLRAKAEYYFNIGEYQTSLEALERAVSLVPLPPERQIIYELFIKNYKAANMPEKVKYYEELLSETAA